MADISKASPTYKLSDVRALGRAAWKQDYLFVENHVFRIVSLPDREGACHVEIRPSSIDEESPLIVDGWMLLPE